ncbi:hypothetical protein ACVIGA_002082 [Bradyrhizobium sp. USDA 3240]
MMTMSPRRTRHRLPLHPRRFRPPRRSRLRRSQPPSRRPLLPPLRRRLPPRLPRRSTPHPLRLPRSPHSLRRPPQAAPVAVAPAPAPTGPIGVWATEENKGNVRVEACGDNLCGYSEKTNERILINMRPDGSKWSGRIHDPDSGRNYDSTIAMKGPNAMRVQGCAFGGMFCGGQTWKRVG